MIATYYTLDGQQVEGGQYSPLTKSLYRAAIDTGWEVLLVNYRQKWALCGDGDKRVLISEQ